MERIKLGSFWTDTASLLLGDPCQLLPPRGQERLTWEDFQEQVARASQALAPPPRQITGPDGVRLTLPWLSSPPPGMVLSVPGHGAEAAVRVQVDSDGYYPVYLEYDEHGQPCRVVIELGGQVRP